jgi:hypothetical protein
MSGLGVTSDVLRRPCVRKHRRYKPPKARVKNCALPHAAHPFAELRCRGVFLSACHVRRQAHAPNAPKPTCCPSPDAKRSCRRHRAWSCRFYLEIGRQGLVRGRFEIGRQACSSSSSAFASFRSRVSKPSVNHPKTGASSSRACCTLPWSRQRRERAHGRATQG